MSDSTPIFAPVPKYLIWPDSNRIRQTHECEFDTLLTSGCSFTSSTLWFDGAASWPGYLRDRCNIKTAVDMSYPGAGNLYIANSIKYAIENLLDQSSDRLLVVVMWSGIDRLEKIISSPDNRTQRAKLGEEIYVQIPHNEIAKSQLKECTHESYDLILDLSQYLNNRNILWAFTYYSNLLFPPFIPKRDTTHHFTDHLDHQKLNHLRSIEWIPKNPMDYLYEWAFVNDYLNDGDGFHPPNQANARWTDEILLPGLVDTGLIKTLCQKQ